MMQIYQDLGVRRFINAAGAYTRLGGSRMPPLVVAAMADAARHFVDMDELQLCVGARLAALTHNDAAYVTSGAAAGLTLATAACMAGTDPARARQLPDVRGLRNQVVMQRAHRNPYDYAVREGTPLVAAGVDGVRSLELANAMLLSGYTGQSLTLPLDRSAYDAFLAEKRGGT